MSKQIKHKNIGDKNKSNYLIRSRAMEIPINLCMNLFPMQISKNKMFKYDFLITPSLISEELKNNIIETFFAENDLDDFVIHDTTVFLKKKIPAKFQNCRVIFQNQEYAIKFSLNETKDLNLKSNVQNELLNGIYKKKGMTQIGRYFFISNNNKKKNDWNNIFPEIKISDNSYSISSGISSSIHLSKSNSKDNNSNKHLLEIDCQSKIIAEKNVYEKIKSLQKKNMSKKKIQKRLENIAFKTIYNNRIYRIDGIDWFKNPKSTFISNQKASDSKEYTFENYVYKKYGIKCIDLNQPLIKSIINKNQIGYFIPEFCKLIMLDNSDSNNPKIRKEISQATLKKPYERKRILESFVKNNNFNKITNNWGLNIEKNMLKIKGFQFENKRINAESVLKKNCDKNCINQKNNSNWANDINRAKNLINYSIKNWKLIIEKNAVKSKMIESFIDKIKTCFQDYGIKIVDPEIKKDVNIFEDIRIIVQKWNTQPQFVLTVTKTGSKKKYRLIKDILIHQAGIPSQNLIGKTIWNYKKQWAIARNLVKQIITKLVPKSNIEKDKCTSNKNGFNLWNIQNSSIKKNTMIIGIDVWHGISGKDYSVAGIVSSFDKGKTYVSDTLKIKRKGWEFLEGLDKIIKRRIMNYYKIEAKIPEAIIIFRDGVGLAQESIVYEKEILSIQLMIEKMQSKEIINKKKIQIALVLANKRIHRRLFYNKTGNQKTENPEPGTWCIDPVCYDDSISNKIQKNVKKQENNTKRFYLVSHSSSRGTIKPVHYSILYNSTHIKDKELLEIAWELSHMYFNWPGTIRIAAPIEYAHKLALLGSNLTDTKFSQKLDGTFFYL